MTNPPTFSTQVLGQAEKALNAILKRELAGTGLSESDWVSLNVTLATGEALNRDRLASRVAGILKTDEGQALAHITELASTGLLDLPDADASPVTVTGAGQRLLGEIRTSVTAITERLYGDVPAEDLAAAGRVLATVLARANAELEQR